MWDWVNDEKLRIQCCSLSSFDKFFLFIWAVLPIFLIERTSSFYAEISKVFQIIGISTDGAMSFLSVLTVLFFLFRKDLLLALFAPPQMNFKNLRDTSAKYFLAVVFALGVFSVYMRWYFPEITETTKQLVAGAEAPDWFRRGLFEEVQYRFILYYAALKIFGRGGAFLTSMFLFAFVHCYSAPYVAQMLFVGHFYMFLMLWSGSLSLPFLVHIISNASLFLIYKLGFFV